MSRLLVKREIWILVFTFWSAVTGHRTAKQLARKRNESVHDLFDKL